MHNIFESARNSQMQAHLNRERKYREERQKKREALYKSANDKVKRGDKSGAISDLSEFIEADYDCTRISNDKAFNSIREDCNILISKFQEKMAQSKLWKESGRCPSCGGRLKIIFEKDISGSESWIDRMCSRKCKSCYNTFRFNKYDLEIKKFRRKWKIAAIIASIAGYLILRGIPFNYSFAVPLEYIWDYLRYELLGNLKIFIPFAVVFFLPWHYYGNGFVKF